MSIFDTLENVAGIGRIKLRLDETNPSKNDNEHSTFIEQEGDYTLITIQETKGGGRTYKHTTKLHTETLLEIIKALGERQAKNFPL